jgi:hypothetical protein
LSSEKNTKSSGLLSPASVIINSSSSSKDAVVCDTLIIIAGNVANAGRIHLPDSGGSHVGGGLTLTGLALVLVNNPAVGSLLLALLLLASNEPVSGSPSEKHCLLRCERLVCLRWRHSVDLRRQLIEDLPGPADCEDPPLVL